MNFQVIVLPDKSLQFKRPGETKNHSCLEDVVDDLRRNPVQAKNGMLVYLSNSASNYTWFVGRMDADACEKTVMAAGHCDYLVRVDPGCEHYVLVINDQGAIKNFKVQNGPRGFILGGVSASCAYVASSKSANSCVYTGLLAAGTDVGPAQVDRRAA